MQESECVALFVDVRDYIALVTDENDAKHCWNDGWGENRAFKRNGCTSAPFSTAYPTWIGLVIKHRSVDVDQSPEPYATQDCAISADI